MIPWWMRFCPYPLTLVLSYGAVHQIEGNNPCICTMWYSCGMALTPNFAANDVPSLSVIAGSPSGGNTVKGQARQDGYWEFLIIEAPRKGMEPPSLPLIRSEGGPISVFHLEPSR